MKKAILIVAILLVALVGLTSYNGKEEHKEKGNGSLLAQLKDTGGEGGTGVGAPVGSGKKPQ